MLKIKLNGKSMDVSDIRKLFPHLQTDQIYFNHAAIGPWSSLVLNRINEYARQRSGAKIENYQSFMKWNINAKEKLGKLLGTTPDRLAWVDNVSNGLNIKKEIERVVKELEIIADGL